MEIQVVSRKEMQEAIKNQRIERCKKVEEALLQEPRRLWTKLELSEVLGVCERTVRRYAVDCKIVPDVLKLSALYTKVCKEAGGQVSFKQGFPLSSYEAWVITVTMRNVALIPRRNPQMHLKLFLMFNGEANPAPLSYADYCQEAKKRFNVSLPPSAIPEQWTV